MDYFAQLGVECEVLRNNVPLEVIRRGQYKAIVLSPGPETPEKADALMDVVAYYHDKLPMLGICLGHQALGTFLAQSLARRLSLCMGNFRESKLAILHISMASSRILWW